jgi:type I restriction enzyme S subunit
MRKLETYETYKRNKIEWIDKIPTHWDEIKVKHIFKERTQKGFPNETLLSATQSKGVIPQNSYGQRTVVATKDFENLKLVKKGDFINSKL